MQTRRRWGAALVGLAMAVVAAVAPSASAAGEFEGRDLIYRQHTDAVHIAWTGEGLDIKVKEGWDTIREAADVAIRLGPDADNEGNEVSRLVVPDDPSYAFLGEPGSIVWHAPQALYWGWPPVWAGIGHGTLPEGLTDLRLELVDDGGPGKVEIFTRTGLNGAPKRTLSSEDPELRSYTPGSHGHYSWAFTEPGIYRMQWRATAMLDGEPVESPVVTVPWLVGPDAEVGLPEGTTAANPILHPVDGEPSEEPSDPGEEPTEEPSEEPSEPAPVDHPFADNITKELRWCTPIPSGHVDLNTAWEDGLWMRLLQDTEEGPQAIGLNGGVLEVSDAAKQPVPAGPALDALRAVMGDVDQVWELPETQNRALPWPGFSTESLDYSDIADLRYRVTDSVAPDGGQWVIGGFDPVKNKFAVQVDSVNRASQSIDMSAPTHMHTGFYFSKPGFYQLTFTAEATPKEGAEMEEYQRRSSLKVTFAVSDAAVAFTCDRTGEGLPSEEPTPAPSPEPTEEPTDEPSLEPTPSAEPTAVPEPTEAVSDTPAPASSTQPLTPVRPGLPSTGV